MPIHNADNDRDPDLPGQLRRAPEYASFANLFRSLANDLEEIDRDPFLWNLLGGVHEHERTTRNSLLGAVRSETDGAIQVLGERMTRVQARLLSGMATYEQAMNELRVCVCRNKVGSVVNRLLILDGTIESYCTTAESFAGSKAEDIQTAIPVATALYEAARMFHSHIESLRHLCGSIGIEFSPIRPLQVVEQEKASESGEIGYGKYRCRNNPYWEFNASTVGNAPLLVETAGQSGMRLFRTIAHTVARRTLSEGDRNRAVVTEITNVGLRCDANPELNRSTRGYIAYLSAEGVDGVMGA